LFAELVRVDRLRHCPPAELAERSLPMLRQHLNRRPQANPFARFARRLTQDLPELQAAGLARYHAWAFASVRQAGAAFELASAHLRWQAGWGRADFSEAADHFDTISGACKSLILKGARAVHSGRPLDASGLTDTMSQAWEYGMDSLDTAVT
jgi:hypothetical protein